MDPVTATIIAGGVSAGASWLGAQSANRANARLSDKQMRFQRQMSNTAHQRQVADLQAAGLNPILSVNSGASAPQGSMAKMDNPVPDVSSALATTLQAKRIKQEVKNLAATENATKAQEAKTKAETRIIQDQQKATEQDAKFYEENPWYRTANRYLQLLGMGTSSAGSAAAGYAIGKTKASRKKASTKKSKSTWDHVNKKPRINNKPY